MHVSNNQPLPMKPMTQSIGAGVFYAEAGYFETGESINVTLTDVSCSFCTSQTVDMYFMTDATFQTYSQGPCMGTVSTVGTSEGATAGTTARFTASTAASNPSVLRNP